jgi:hypothetical protein
VAVAPCRSRSKQGSGISRLAEILMFGAALLNAMLDVSGF